MKTITGIVVSNKMQNTIVVATDTYKTHTKYHKRYKITKKFYAHNPWEVIAEGTKVTIQESRPLSKLKRWTIVA